MLAPMLCLHWGQPAVSRRTTRKFTMATHMSTHHSSCHSFRITLWGTHITCQLMQQQLQPSWAFCTVAASKGVQVLEAILACQEARYLEGSGGQGWEELAFPTQWQPIATG